MQTLEFTLPDWSLSALINGDYSGLNDEDIKKIEKFTSSVVENYGNAFFTVNEVSNLGFLSCNDIDNLGANCTTAYLLIQS